MVIFYYYDNVKCQEIDSWCLFLMGSNGWLTSITSERFLVVTAFSGCFGSIIIHSYIYLPSELTIKLLTTVLNPCLLMLWMPVDRCSFVVLSFRSSILSEVSTRSSSKLPSGKNILLFGICLFCWIWFLIQIHGLLKVLLTNFDKHIMHSSETTLGKYL